MTATIFDEIRERIAGTLKLRSRQSALTQRQIYGLYELYYGNNGLYGAAARQLYEVDTWRPDMAALRTPVNRVVEFYAAHVWPGELPGALPIVAANDRIAAPIQAVWRWSNWGANKTLAARWASLFGNLFLKASQRDDKRPYLQLIEPEYVTDFETDERGFVTWIRLDTEHEDDGGEAYTLTEVWSKADGTFRRWDHDQGPEADLEDLGAPADQGALADFGIDFVPFVHAKFRDTGDPLGANAFVHALDKIDEANLQATRLHRQLFRHNGVTWGLEANSMDADGKPLPAPRISNIGAGEDEGEVTLGDERMVRLPGMSKLVPLVPNLQYDAALAILNAQMLELEKDLPELAYYRLREIGGDLSGRAVRLLLSDAIVRVDEARGNLGTALARADAMALTMGAAAKLDEFAGIGTYAKGDFEHTFKFGDVIPVSDDEKAATVKAWTDSGMSLLAALRRVGATEEEIAQVETDQRRAAANNQTALGTSLTAALRQFNAGQGQ